jgi:hypothetical protein
MSLATLITVRGGTPEVPHSLSVSLCNSQMVM